MPAVASSTKILITGGSGYVGAVSLKSLLEHGFTVLSVYRKESQADFARQAFKEYADKGKLETLVVADITKEGALDDAVKEVDAILHTASPATFAAAHPDELLVPAVDATLNLLKSAKKAGVRVKRVVITSSIAACQPPWYAKEYKVYGPDHWGDASVKAVEELGLKSSPQDWYVASKVLAEKSAWNFVEQEKPSFDLVTVLPSFVLGPWEHEVPNREALASSAGILAAYLTPNPPEPLNTGFVDGRDVGDIQSLALLTEAAGGERLIASAAPFSTEFMYQLIDEAKPPFQEGIIPKRERVLEQQFALDWSHARTLEILPNFSFRTWQQSVTDQLRLMEQKGWLTTTPQA